MEFFVHLGIRTRSVRADVLNAKLVRLEIEAVKKLLALGTVRQAWKRADAHSVVLLVEALSESECRAVLATLPFSKAEILDIQMIAPVEPYLDVYANPLPD
jgi:muconolactone delta-isomerase